MSGMLPGRHGRPPEPGRSFLSGAAALLFEALWLRRAGLMLGSSVWASSIVLAAFMTGLAVGNALAVRWAARIRRPLRVYALLELGVGAAGTAAVLATPALAPVLAPLFRALGDARRADESAAPRGRLRARAAAHHGDGHHAARPHPRRVARRPRLRPRAGRSLRVEHAGRRAGRGRRRAVADRAARSARHRLLRGGTRTCSRRPWPGGCRAGRRRRWTAVAEPIGDRPDRKPPQSARAAPAGRGLSLGRRPARPGGDLVSLPPALPLRNGADLRVHAGGDPARDRGRRPGGVVRGCDAIRPRIAGCPRWRARRRWPRSPATPPSRPGTAAPPSSSRSRTPRWRCRCA